MACNCGKKGQAPKTYVYVDPSGRQTKFASEVQAKAEKIRRGNKGIVKPA